MNTQMIGFIGFGLIGGSIARTLRRLHPQKTLIAYNYRYPSANPNLEEALADGVLSRIENNLEPFSACDIIFLCAPVLTNIKYLKELKKIIRPDCILTDVGSVKGNIHHAVEELGLSAQFVGGHPMAGAEKTSYHASFDGLMKGAYYILTPSGTAPEEMLDTLRSLVLSLEAVPIVMEPSEHDDAVAAISHIPHVTAAALVNLVRNQKQSAFMRRICAGGFKDITRIASSSSEMWQNICLSNKDSLLKFLKELCGTLLSFSSMLEQDDADGIYQYFADAKQFRDQIPDKNQRNTESENK